MSEIAADALLIPDTVAAALAGVSRSTWHVLRAAGRVPPCVRLGVGKRKIVRWRRAEVFKHGVFTAPRGSGHP